MRHPTKQRVKNIHKRAIRRLAKKHVETRGYRAALYLMGAGLDMYRTIQQVFG